MAHEILKTFNLSCEETLNWYEERIKTLRTGRATPELVENVPVEAYGQRQPLKHVATISVPQPQCITVQPWDKALMPDIERALSGLSLGLNPSTESGIINLRLPPLTEERRKELVKVLKGYTEEAQIRIRRCRDEAWSRIKEQEQEKSISEDEKFRLKDDLQEQADTWKERVVDLYSKKEKEILSS